MAKRGRKPGRKVGSIIRLAPGAARAKILSIHRNQEGVLLGYNVQTSNGRTLDVNPDGSSPYKNIQHMAEGGKVGRPEDGLRHALLSTVSSGTIGSMTGLEKYKDIEGVRLAAVQVLQRDGDKPYSLKNLKDTLMEAKDEYAENRAEGQYEGYAKGGQVAEQPETLTDGRAVINAALQYFSKETGVPLTWGDFEPKARYDTATYFQSTKPLTKAQYDKIIARHVKERGQQLTGETFNPSAGKVFIEMKVTNDYLWSGSKYHVMFNFHSGHHSQNFFIYPERHDSSGNPLRMFAKGGKVADTSGMSVREFLKSLNQSALPEQAAMYLDTQMLSDPDMDLLSREDEEVQDLVAMIEKEFPGALSGAPATEAEPAGELTLKDYQDALAGAEVLLEFEGEGKGKKDLEEYISGLKTMIELSA